MTVIDHPAEFWALNSVQGALEKILVEPFASNYAELKRCPTDLNRWDSQQARNARVFAH